jgi:hypothetical protein
LEFLLPLLVVLALVVVVVSFVTASHGSTPDWSNPLTTSEQSHTITVDQALHTELGMSRAAVESQLGRTPESPSALRRVGVAVDLSCIYYNIAKQEFGSYIEFCFHGGRLSSYDSVIAGSAPLVGRSDVFP